MMNSLKVFQDQDHIKQKFTVFISPIHVQIYVVDVYQREHSTVNSVEYIGLFSGQPVGTMSQV